MSAPAEPLKKVVAASIRLLTIGLDPSELASLSSVLVHCKNRHLPMDIDKLTSGAMATATEGEAEAGFTPDLIICGEPPHNVSIEEVAQTVRMQFPNVPMFCVLRRRKLFHRRMLVKNGFNDAFLFPFEAGVMRRVIHAKLTDLTQNVIKSYRAVRMSEIKANTELPFNLAIYMPINRKYVHFITAGNRITLDHFDKLKAKKIASVFVDSAELPKFYQYALFNARTKNPTAKIGATERRHKFEDRVREVLGGMFRGESELTIEDGQKIVQDLQEAIHAGVMGTPTTELRAQVLAMMGEMQDDFYSHFINVAAYAALFSMALEIGNPLEVGLAGLLHDMGMIDVPSEVSLKHTSKYDEAEMDIYKKHVEASISILQQHRLTVGGTVMKVVLQHHEQYDSKGFPNVMNGAGFIKEAQIVALADQFDYVTRFEEGQTVRTTDEALEDFRKVMLDNPDQVRVDPALVKRLLAFLGKAVA